MEGLKPIQTDNPLGQLYRKQPVWVRSKIRADLEAHGLTYQRMSYWLKVQEDNLLMIPLICYKIICQNIPEAEKFFNFPVTAHN